MHFEMLRPAVLSSLRWSVRLQHTSCMVTQRASVGLGAGRDGIVSRSASTGLKVGPVFACRNVMLMGPPGAGKTSAGVSLAELLGWRHWDMDNDHLEAVWKCSVAEKLAEVGGERFVAEEGQATLQLPADITQSVISLSGSNPMDDRAMSHLSKSGLVVYLDVDRRDILQRLEAMKVNRIVGQTEDVSMEEILRYRERFYERWYHWRCIVPSGSSVQETADFLMRALERHSNVQSGRMLTSTRSASAPEPDKDRPSIVKDGLATDGGLCVPREQIPRLSAGQWKRLVDLNFQKRAVRILELWQQHNTGCSDQFAAMIDKAYSSFAHPGVAPVLPLPTPTWSPDFDGRLHLLQLFWGPTASFKDLSLQLMPQMLRRSAASRKFAMVVATSGDTGSAALDGFGAHTDYPVIVFYPARGVSERQEQQMVSLAARYPWCHAVGVDGDFDFCQSTVKSMFADARWSADVESRAEVSLNGANSINWMRLLPQVVHHASAYLELVRNGHVQFGDTVHVCIPTGNFGNMMAAIYAKRMGIPFGKFVLASNANNVLEEFLSTGVYDVRERSLVRTMSPAIDILLSSNVERLLHLLASESGDTSTVAWAATAFKTLQTDGVIRAPDDLVRTLRDTFVAVSVTEDECRRQIERVFVDSGHAYLPDPHSAVALACFHGDENRARLGEALGRVSPVVVACTAHWEKFPDTVLPALSDASRAELLSNTELGHHSCLQEALDRFDPMTMQFCPANVNAMKRAVEKALGL